MKPRDVDIKAHIGLLNRDGRYPIGMTYTVRFTQLRAIHWRGNFGSGITKRCAQRGGWFIIAGSVLEGFLGWGRTPTLAMDSAIENALSKEILLRRDDDE